MPALGVSILASGPEVSGLLPPNNTPIPGIWRATGPMLLGHIFNWGLLGVLSMQVYIYATAFSRSDRRFMQALVWGIFILDILQTGFATHYAWWVLVSGWGNPWTLRFTPKTLGLIPVLTGLISLSVQFFYAWRIRILGASRMWWPVIAFILLTSLGSCAAACYAGIMSNINVDVATRPNLVPPVTVWLALSSACDVVITVTLVYQLWKRQNQGSGRYNGVIHRAMRMCVETNGVTTLVTLAQLITFVFRDSSSWYYLFGMCIGKLYTNSFVATLNARGQFTHRNKRDTEITDSHSSELDAWKVATVPDGKRRTPPDESEKGAFSHRGEAGSSLDLPTQQPTSSCSQSSIALGP